MDDPPKRSGSRETLRVVLPVAILLGLAGAVLLAPSPANPGVALLPEVQAPAAPSWLGVALVLGFVGFFVVVGVARRLAGYRGVEGPLLVSLLVCGGLLVLFDEIFRLLHRTSLGPAVNRTLTNGTTNTSCSPSDCPPVGLPGGGGGGAVAPWYEGATLYVLILVAVLAVALLYPRLDAYLSPRQPSPARRPEGPGELEAALQRLGEAGPGDDARRRIIRAYGELLARVAAPLEHVAPRTPREIAREIVQRFGVGQATAEEITALFEEARYSTGRPMGASDVRRAEDALTRAIDEASRARDGSA